MNPSHADMKKRMGIAIIATLLLALPLTAGAQWLVGVRGEASVSSYDYSALSDETHRYPVTLNYGIGMEWHPTGHLALGIDAVHSTRRTSLRFSIPYLVSFSQTAFTDISFALTEKCVDLSLPVALYLLPTNSISDFNTGPFLFVAPCVCLMYGGTLQWTRTHLADGTVLASYELPLSTASSSGYDYGIRSGIGTAFTLKVGSRSLMVKAVMEAFFGLNDTFSDLEKANLLPADHYYGLGDIAHEQLGERHIRQVTLSLSLSLPLRDQFKDACYGFDRNRFR